MTVLRAAGRGLALGALAVTLLCAAYAARAFHTGAPILDSLIGIGLTVLPLGALVVGLRVVAVLLKRLVGRRSAVVLPALSFVGHPLVATTLGIVLLVWSPADGPLGLYHSLFYFEILIVAGAIVGLLAGAGLEVARRSTPGTSRRRALAVVGLMPALVLGMSVGAWAALPGAGRPPVREDAAAVAKIPPLELADPSVRGPYEVVEASYGSGADGRRPEFGAGVDWRTETVDGSGALADRGGFAETYARWFWGFDTAHLPINALVWYPAAAPGRLPVVLLVHGNHDAGDYSDPGYAYLAEHLASRGMIAASVDENFLNGDAFFDYAGAEIGVRAWLLLQHLERFRVWDGTPGHPLAGRVDLERVALIGHSRGGEAAALAAMLAADPTLELRGMPATSRDFDVRTVIAFAPSDGMYRGQGAPVTLRDVDYLVVQGAHDGDLPAFTGIHTYHRVSFTGGDHLKVALYSGRANHGRFNTVWDYGDAGILPSWMLDRGPMLSIPEQQHLAKTVVSAFLARSLEGDAAYDAFFREPRAGRAWLPDDVIETHWQSSRRVVLDDFTIRPLDKDGRTGDGFEEIASADPPLRDAATQLDRAVHLTWLGDAVYTIDIDTDEPDLDPAGSLVFAMAPSSDGEVPCNPVVELRSANGGSAVVRLAAVAPGRPLLPSQLWKIAGLGDRYLSGEKHYLPADRFLQTYEVKLSAFDSAVPGFALDGVVSVAFRFEGAGSVYLDDVGYEPPVQGG